MLLLQNVLALLLALREGDVEGLIGKDVPVHLRDGLRRLLLRVEAHEPEALGGALLVAHDLRRRDGAKGREGLAQLLVVHIVVQVFDEKVNAGELVGTLHLECLKLVAQLTLSVALLLRAAHEHGLAVHLSVVECLACLGSVLMLLEVDEAETTRLALAVLHDDGRLDRAMRFEELVQLLILHVRGQILHVDIRERVVGLAAARTVLARHEETDKDLLAIEQHAVHLGHSEVGGFLRLVVHEACNGGARQASG